MNGASAALTLALDPPIEASARFLAASSIKSFLHRCAGRPARSRWCKSTTMKE